MFGAQSLAFRVWGLWFRVRVQVQDLGTMVWGSVKCFMLKPRHRYAGTPLSLKYIIQYIYMRPSGSVRLRCT